MKQPLALQVNGDTYELYIEPHKTLAEVLREDSGRSCHQERVCAADPKGWARSVCPTDLPRLCG